MPSKVSVIGPDNIWKYKEVTPAYADGYYTYFVTSSLYPALIVESLTGSGSLIRIDKDQWYTFSDSMAAFGSLLNVTQETTDPVYPHSYSYPAETLSGFGILLNVIKETTDPVYPHGYSLTESLLSFGSLLNVTKEEVAAGTPIYYTNWPADRLQGSGSLISVTKETV